MARQKKEYSDIFETVPVVILDGEHHIRSLTRGAKELLYGMNGSSGNGNGDGGKALAPSSLPWKIDEIIAFAGSGADETSFESAFETSGGTRYFQMRLKRLPDTDGRYGGTAVMLNDITAMKKAEEQVRSTLKEKEVLLKEIHHRVKNNLAVIASILSLQSDLVGDERSREALKECRSRATSMAMIHAHLYQSRDLTHVDFKSYLTTLAEAVFNSYRLGTDNVVLKVTADDLSLTINRAIPVGLIANELITNAMQHAFPDGRKGKIHVELTREGNQARLTVSDNGIGLPVSLDVENTESLGLQLVMSLVEQLDASLEVEGRKGTRFRITFTVLEK